MPYLSPLQRLQLSFLPDVWYKRKLLGTRPPNSLKIDLQQIDERLNLLTCTSLSTPYEKQNQSLKQELESFFALSQGENRSCPPHLATFVDSLFGKIIKGKHKYIPVAVPILASMVFTPVVARLDYHITPLAPIQASFVQSLPQLGARMNGNIPYSLETPPQPLK